MTCSSSVGVTRIGPHNAILATIERAEEWSRGPVIGCCAPHGPYRRPTRYVNQRRDIAASRSGHIVRTFTAVFERCSDGGNVPAAGRHYDILAVTEFSHIRPPRLLCELFGRVSVSSSLATARSQLTIGSAAMQAEG